MFKKSSAIRLYPRTDIAFEILVFIYLSKPINFVTLAKIKNLKANFSSVCDKGNTRLFLYFDNNSKIHNSHCPWQIQILVAEAKKC